MSTEIAVLNTTDVDALAELVNSAYRGETSLKGWTSEAGFLDGQRTDPLSLGEQMNRPGSVVLGLRREGVLVGCVHLERVADVGGDVHSHLGMLTIAPGLQAEGLGRQLLAAAETYAVKTWSTRRMVLSVIHLRHELIAWYKRRGYKPTGETLPFPYGDERFGRPKRPDLHFVVFAKTL